MVREEAAVYALYHAYESYERRVMRGEFAARSASSRPPLAVRIGDLLINTGLRLKQAYYPKTSLGHSSFTGSAS
jgi:hypothetical protein